MRSSQREAGTTLVEVVIVVAMVALFIGVIGVFFLGTAPGAVSAAEHDVSNAFDEARRTAVAYESATVVFAPEPAGRGFTARVYRAAPGDALFTAVNGPIYENISTVAETAVPLGAPGFAFAISGNGKITGYRNYTVGGALDPQPCPAANAFTLRISAAGDTKTLTIPCHITLHSNLPIVRESPNANVSPIYETPGSCPAGKNCTLAANVPGSTSCPPGYTQDPVDPSLCDPPTPPPAPSGSSPGPSGGSTAGAIYVCSSQPYGTDLGLDPDGIDEDYSSAVPCHVNPSPSASSSSRIPVNVATCSSRPPGTDLGLDPNGIDEDISNGISCTQTNPSPTPSSSRFVIESDAMIGYDTIGGIVASWTSYLLSDGTILDNQLANNDEFAPYAAKFNANKCTQSSQRDPATSPDRFLQGTPYDAATIGGMTPVFQAAETLGGRAIFVAAYCP